jgi:toxin ParE1/3/4
VRRHRRHRAVEPELRAAARRYEAAVPGLGSDFLDEVETAIDAIVEKPRAWARVAGLPEELEVRRYVLDRFPYYIPFLVDERGAVVILAVAHEKRRPRFWARRAAPKKSRSKK